jgi:hypothetical protein
MAEAHKNSFESWLKNGTISTKLSGLKNIYFINAQMEASSCILSLKVMALISDIKLYLIMVKTN